MPHDEPRPFAFEDLPVNEDGKRIEPEIWGPVYDIKRQRGKTISEVVRAKQLSELHSLASASKCHVNIKADLKYKYSSARTRAALITTFHAQAAADRRAWAMGQDIAKAYKVAMKAKRAWLANERANADRAPQRDAFRPRKPHYTVRDGKLMLAA